MFGQINRISAAQGDRDALMEVMGQASDSMPGCRSYAVGRDIADPDTIWVADVWDVVQSHLASLDLPDVKASIEKAMPLIAAFETVAPLEVPDEVERPNAAVDRGAQ